VNDDLAARFQKQAAWQRSRAAGPWAEKLRTAAAMRSALTFVKKEQPPSLPQPRPRPDMEIRTTAAKI